MYKFRVNKGISSTDRWKLKKGDEFEVQEGKGYKGCPFKQLIALSKGPVVTLLEPEAEAKDSEEFKAKEKAKVNKTAAAENEKADDLPNERRGPGGQFKKKNKRD